MQIRSSRLIYSGIVVLFLLLTVGISSADDVNVELVSHFGGVVSDVAVDSNYAYIGQGQDLVVLDITNASKPAEVGRVTTPSTVTGVAVASNYAYVVSEYDGLTIVDITNPASPILAGTYDTAEWAMDVVVAGNYAYIADFYNGLMIFDITNPASPTLAGIYDATFAYDVDVAGNYAYVATHRGFHIVNISNPSSPTLAGSYATRYASGGVAVAGNYVFMSDVLLTTNFFRGLVIVDISDPSSPTLAGSYEGGGGGVAVAGNYAYVGGGGSLSILNISNPSSPILAGSYDSGGSSTVVAVAGNYAYVAAADSGLVIVDISDPSSPTLASSYDTTGWVKDVAVAGNYAYITRGEYYRQFQMVGQLQIVDMINPSSPTLVGVYDTYSELGGCVGISGNYAYVTSGVDMTDRYFIRLEIVNVTDPSSPTLVGSYDTVGGISGIVVSGNYAYLANNDNGLEIVDITNPSSPTLAGTYTAAGGAKDVVVAGNYAHVACGSDLVILDISDPSAPTLAGSYTMDSSENVAISGNYACIAAGESGLVIVDVSDPSSPTLAGSYDTGQEYALNVAVESNYAYVAYADGGLMVVDITDPSAPTFAGSYDTNASGVWGVTIFGNYAYIANGDNGLVVLRVDAAPTNTVSYTPDYDNRLRQSTPNTVLSSSNYIDIGRLSTTSYRDVMWFNLSGYKTNDTISKATLSLYWYYPAGATRTSDTVVEIYRPVEWDPQYVTWNSRMSDTSWNTTGGNWFDKNGVAQGSTPYASVTFPAGTVPDNKYYEFNVTQLVKEYVTGTNNTGFFLKAKTEGNNYIAFYSSEWPNAEQRPKLNITSVPADNPPVAEAGPDQVATTGEAVTFNGSASTDDKGITTYSWDFDVSDGITTEATGVTVNTTYATAGNYTVTLTVTDTAGQTDSDTLQVVVASPVTTTTVSYTPDYDNRLRQSSPNTVFSSSNYIDIGRLGTTSYRDVMLFDLSGYNPADTISKATLSLYWYYPAGATRTSDTVVEIYRPVEWDPQYVTWNSRMSGMLWDTPGGNWYDKNGVAQGTTPYASVTFQAGTVPDNKYHEFDVTQLVQEYVTGTNNTGFFLKAKTESNNYIAFYSSDWPNADQRPKLNITSTSGTTPTDNPPVAEAGADKTATAGSDITFDGSASTDDKGIVLYSWNFGDGTTSSGVTPTHTYAAAGTYNVTLTVTDTVGQTDSDTLQVVVSSPTTTTFTPTYDNRLRQSSPNTVFSSSNYIDIGRLGTTSYRDVMLFDLSGYTPSDTISKATLSLFWYYPPNTIRTSDTVVEVYRPVEWSPQYVTWNSRMSGMLWDTPGGNWYDKNGVAQGTTPYASLTLLAGTVPDNKYYEFDVTQLVQEYVTGTTNTGFFLKAKTEGNNYIAFYSSDWSNADQRPKLNVTSS